LLSRRTFCESGGRIGAGLLGAYILPGIVAKARAAEPLTIGWIRPTTGLYASSYAPLYLGGRIAMDEINAAGGILGRQLVVREEDDEAAPSKEPAVARKLQDAGVEFVLGPTGSAQVLASLPVMTSAKIIQAGIAGVAALGDAKKYPYHYHLTATASDEATVMVEYMVSRLKIMKVGMLLENAATGEELISGFNSNLARLGVTALETQVFPVTAPDMTPYVNALRKQGCEGILFFIQSNAQIANAFRSMGALKWAPTVVAHFNIFNEGLFDLVPPEALANVYGAFYRNFTYTDAEPARERNVKFAQKLQKIPEAAKVQSFVAATGNYDFLYMLQAAIESTKSFDPDVIKRTLDTFHGYDGLLGKFTFTPEKHSGLDPHDITIASVSSAHDPRTVGCLRLRAPGA
jgi:ABC-type branched-subunit amino acid transport system substrate-binding protein